jgi:hypothetical protein
MISMVCGIYEENARYKILDTGGVLRYLGQRQPVDR